MSKKVLILYTGGTIGMRKTARGYVPAADYLGDEIKRLCGRYGESLPDITFMQFSPLLDSSDVSSEEWNRIGGTIYREYERFDGFVILHGTDTMAYTASALSFMLSGLMKPVILTGSQIPLCEIRSDAEDNIITSLMIAAEGRVSGVCLYFAGKLLRGCRATKRSADGFDAFSSPNFPILAEAGISIRYSAEAKKPTRMRGLSLTALSDIPIGIIKVFPGIDFKLFEPILTGSLRGVIIEAFGTGNIPHAEKNLLPLMRSRSGHGAVFVVCSQCRKGTVTLGAYETSHALKEAGAVSAHDMTTEAAVTKLYYLLSLGIPRGEVVSLMEKDICGEITENEP